MWGGSGDSALARVFRWSALRRKPDVARVEIDVAADRPDSEQSALDFLAHRSVPVIPSQMTRSSEEAVSIARSIGEPVLNGMRGVLAVDRQALAEMIVRIGDAALALGPDLVSLEVNLLWVRGTHIEALDALAERDKKMENNDT